MSVFQFIDRDKAITFMAFYWWVPMRWWRDGILEEIPFLHELFGHSRRNGHRWDIGLRSPAPVQYSLARLHQQGAHRTDQFGSDFAITIDIQGRFTLRKTALFQTKLANNYSATVERSQLDEVLSHPQFRGRAYTMAVDRVHSVIRLQSAELLASAFPNQTQATMTFDTTEWMSSTEFFIRWLECGTGLPSTSFDTSPIEHLLAARIEDADDRFPRFEGGSLNLPSDDRMFVPRFWHHFTIKINE